jgi:hypothetical protein
VFETKEEFIKQHKEEVKNENKDWFIQVLNYFYNKIEI